MQYVTELSQKDVIYSPFNLCIFEPQSNHGYEALYYKNTYTNIESGKHIPGEGPTKLSAGVSGFGNHPISVPYNKTSFGIKEFKFMVERNLSVKDFEEEAIVLLNNKQQMYPDEQMQKQSGIFQKKQCKNSEAKFGTGKEPCSSERMHSAEVETHNVEGKNQEYKMILDKEPLLSSIFVDIGDIYGTRVQTIVFVDYNSNVYFTERSRIAKTHPFEWKVTKYNFKFNEN